jgi:hypothetical protein
MDHLVKLWDNNQTLWSEFINKEILIPLDQRGGLKLNEDDDGITATSFAASLETFQAVQLLCNPRADQQFWANGFVLTRNTFETFVTLQWIHLDRKERSALFRDEYVLKMAHFLRLVDKEKAVVHYEKAEVRPEKRAEILSWHQEVINRRKCSPDKQKLLPDLQERVREIAPKATRYQNLEWEYEVYYRDVSSFSHPSGWGLWSNLPMGKGPIEMKSSPAIGVKALTCNGGWFLRVLWIWNEVFQVVPQNLIRQWESRWTYGIMAADEAK